MMKPLFLIGSPRSGTTLLENMLACHRNVAEFYEPYYLWERWFPVDEDDVWDEARLTAKTADRIRREFFRYARKSGRMVAMVVDKSPTHAFNIPVIRKVFPEALWLHILRDGRDVTLSIRKEWQKRKMQVEQKDFLGLLRLARDMLGRQPFWRYRLMAVLHEVQRNRSLDPRRYLNKARWKGEIGWGPRFPGWRGYLARHSSVEFNAMQWVACVSAIHRHWDAIPQRQRLLVRYEELLSDPARTLSTVMHFMGYEADDDFLGKIPAVKEGNTGKWKKAFSSSEIEKIRPVLANALEQAGYIQASPW